MKREENNKNLKVNGDTWSAKAIGINLPSNDVTITLKIKGVWTQQEVKEHGKLLKELIDEWFFDSIVLDPKHLIREVIVPTGYTKDNIKYSMQLIIHINCLTRKQIQMGAGIGCFKDTFQGELDRLIECFGLETAHH